MTTQTSWEQTLGRRDLFLLHPEVTFLNNGSFGACPRTVFETYQQWQLELERDPVDFIARQLNDLLVQSRQALAREIGAETDRLALVTNATMGVNIVAQALDLQPGDQVLSTDLEYGAVDHTWDVVCAQRGAQMVRAAVPWEAGSREAIVEAIWSRVTERTRILSMSHITSGTALLLPIEELVARCRQAGVLTLIDGAHAPGQIPLALDALGADYYVGSCHKWMMVPKGVGFLYARPEAQEQIGPLLLSHSLADDTDPRERFALLQQHQGTRDMASFLSIPAAINFAHENDWDTVRAASHDLVVHALEQVAAMTGIAPAVPLSSDWFAQMAIAPLPLCDPDPLRRDLWEAFRIEIPVVTWHDRPFLRISIQGYNSETDVLRLLDALAVLLPERVPQL